jgi:hydroxymethylpyrimidine/phosphomethylpyrimidine kinase
LILLGAGILADAKTFEQHHVYGFAVNTGNTIQTENEFFEIQWTDLDFVLKSLEKFSKTTILKPSKLELFLH